MDKELTVIPQLDGLENISIKVMKEEPSAFKMGRDGYPKLKHIDPEVIPPNRVFHSDLGVGDNVVRLSFGIQPGGNTPSTTGVALVWTSRGGCIKSRKTAQNYLFYYSVTNLLVENKAMLIAPKSEYKKNISSPQGSGH